MTLLFIISATITIFLFAAGLFLMLGGNEAVDERLMEIAASRQGNAAVLEDAPKTGLGQMAAGVIDALKPLRDLISRSDEDIAYRLALAGFRKTQHVEAFTALKILLPIIGIVAGTFFGSNM